MKYSYERERKFSFTGTSAYLPIETGRYVFPLKTIGRAMEQGNFLLPMVPRASRASVETPEEEAISYPVSAKVLALAI